MACHQARRDLDLPLPVEGVEQRDSECLDTGGKIIKTVATLAGDARRRHVEIAGEIERDRSVQDAAHGLGMAVGRGDPNPLDHLMDGIGMGEDVVGCFPVRVLVGAAEISDPERRRIGERAAEVGGHSARAHRCLERIHNGERIIAEERAGERRVIRPAGPNSSSGEQAR